MLMILISTVSLISVIRLLICGNDQSWLLNLNLTTEHCRLGQEVAHGFQCWKNSCDCCSNSGAIDMKKGGFVVEEKSSFKLLGLYFFSKLDLGSYIASVAKTVFKEIGALIHEVPSPEVVLYFYESTTQPYMEYCCHVWAGTLSCYVDMLVSYNCWSNTYCLS